MDTFLREEKRKYDTNEMVLGISQKVPLQASGRPDPDDFHFRSRHRKIPYVSGMIVDDVIQGGQYDLLWKLVLILLLVTAGPRCPRFFYHGYFRGMLAGRALRHAGRCLPPPSDRGLRLLTARKKQAT